MGKHTTEVNSEIPSRKPLILLDVRKYECAYLSPSDEARPDSFNGRVGYRGGSLFSQGGRLNGMPRPSGASGTLSELSGSDEPDWLDGPTLETPMPRDIQEFSASERGAYNLGVTDERLRRVRNF